MKALLQRWLTPRPVLDAQQSARLSAWLALPEIDRAAGLGHARCVVVDVETTGLNLMTDSLISIGAVGVINGRIALGDRFSVVLQQSTVSRRENILVHGISGSAQREGEPPAAALLSFLEYLGKDPLVAFHVTFDETMIGRAIRHYLGFRFRHPWLDLAYVLPALFPERMHSHRSLDDWSDHFSIPHEYRHDAMSDALATAQLFLVAINAAARKGIASHAGMRNLEHEYRSARGI